MRWGRAARAAAVAAVRVAAVVVADDSVPADVGSTVEASSVQNSVSDGNSTASDYVEPTWRTGGFGETPGQMVVMLIAISFASMLVVVWICSYICRAGEDKPVRKTVVVMSASHSNGRPLKLTTGGVVLHTGSGCPGPSVNRCDHGGG